MMKRNSIPSFQTRDTLNKYNFDCKFVGNYLLTLSYLHTAENISPPNRLANQRFFIMASFKESHSNFASILVCTARPIPSNTIKSTVTNSLANSSPKRLKK